MARKKKSGGGESGGANWMDTYGDLVTLLLTFFVLLFASSTISESKWIEIVESFTGEPAGKIIEPIDMRYPAEGFSDADNIERRDSDSENKQKSQEQKELEEEFNQLYEQLQAYVGQNGMENSVGLNKEGLYILVTIMDGILFDSGQATIKDEAAEDALQGIGDMAAAYLPTLQNITIEGHTDNVPISNAQFADNFDLSSIRANNVLRFMSDSSGIDKSYFDSVGRGEFRPIASNDTEEGKQQNRRVNVIFQARNLDEPEQTSISDVELDLVEQRPQVVTNDGAEISG